MSSTQAEKGPPFDWDAEWYVSHYPDIAKAVSEGHLTDPLQHYLEFGCHEGRFPSAAAERTAALASTSGAPLVTLGEFAVPLNWPVRGEVSKTFAARLSGDLFQRFLSGAKILDVGYRGGHPDAVPILPHATGVDLDYPGYDGRTLPFGDNSVDAVFSSHVLEHVDDDAMTIRDWFRVIRSGGFIVCVVPHQYLYERKREMPSNWSGEHRRFYTPGSLLAEFESVLEPNTYRVRHLADNDRNYRYDLSIDQHPGGCYEIELVIQKIEPPAWKLG